MNKTTILQRVLLVLALVLLACAVKNYLVFLVRGTALCPYLCPSALGSQLWTDLPLLEHLFGAQRALMRWLQDTVDLLVDDHWHLAIRLLAAPVIEELIYRGPFYLTRRHAGRVLWWAAGLAAAVVFALSHARGGLALLPLLVLGGGGLWLVARTQRL
ncbi:MAG: CPBP family glutamic-type intramembrane protease, partial [Gammaproteobacteria bacterium]